MWVDKRNRRFTAGTHRLEVTNRHRIKLHEELLNFIVTHYLNEMYHISFSKYVLLNKKYIKICRSKDGLQNLDTV